MAVINTLNTFESSFGIGDDGRLYATGDNKYGKLGCDSSLENISDWSPVYIKEEDGTMNFFECEGENVKDFVLESGNEKNFYIFKQNDKYYFSGKFGNENYTSLIELDRLLNKFYPFKRSVLRNDEHIFNKNYFNTINVTRYVETFLFEVSKNRLNGNLCIDLNIYTPSDVLSLVITGDYRNGLKFYNEYAILPKNDICIIVRESKNYLLFYILVQNSNDVFLQENSVRISYYVNSLFDNMSIEHTDTSMQSDGIYKQVQYLQSDIGYFGDETDSHIIEIPTSNTKYKMIDINLDIGEINSILKDEDIKENEYEDKEIIPYEDEMYKGPQFLYPIFYNTGIPFNKFVPFEGLITKDGKEYLVSHVRISNSINNEGKNGVIQFLLSPENKFLSEEGDVIFENDSKNESENFRLFAITFYPIIDNGAGRLVYQFIDNIPNSIITQEKGILNLPIEIAPKKNISDPNKINARVIKRDDGRYVMICHGKIIGKEREYIYLVDIESGIVLAEIGLKNGAFFNVTKYNDEYVFAIVYYGDDVELYYNLISPYDGHEIIEENEYGEGFIEDNVTEPDDYYKINIDTSNVYEYNSPTGLRFQCKNNYCIIGNIQNTNIEFDFEFDNNETYENGGYCTMKFLSNIPGVINFSTSDTVNANVLPAIVQTLDGVLMVNDSIIRDGFPKPFTIKY